MDRLNLPELKRDLQNDVDVLIRQLELINIDNEALRKEAERHRQQKKAIDQEQSKVQA
jgi:hypothetical protein